VQRSNLSISVIALLDMHNGIWSCTKTCKKLKGGISEPVESYERPSTAISGPMGGYVRLHKEGPIKA